MSDQTTGISKPPKKAPFPKGELSFTRIRKRPLKGKKGLRDFRVVEATGDCERR